MPPTSMYKGIFQGLNCITKKENINKIPHDLPILLIAGAKDPVGDMGSGIKHLYEIMYVGRDMSRDKNGLTI